MTNPSPEFERRVEASYSRLKPERLFQGCKVAEDERGIIVRVYSQSRHRPAVLPPPYETYRFDAATSTLSRLTDEEAAPYRIRNYK